jgi:hypothetical protein
VQQLMQQIYDAALWLKPGDFSLPDAAKTEPRSSHVLLPLLLILAVALLMLVSEMLRVGLAGVVDASALSMVRCKTSERSFRHCL